MTAYMSIGYHIHHSYVACKTNKTTKILAILDAISMKKPFIQLSLRER